MFGFVCGNDGFSTRSTKVGLMAVHGGVCRRGALALGRPWCSYRYEFRLNRFALGLRVHTPKFCFGGLPNRVGVVEVLIS